MRRRRTIAVVGAACAVVIAIIIGYAISPAHRSDRRPQPLTTPSPQQIGGMPDYLMGAHVIQEVTLTAVHPREELTFVPPARGGLLLSNCQMTTRSVTVDYTVADGDTTRGWPGCSKSTRC